MIPLTIVPGDNIKIEASLDKFTSSPKISGTDWAPELSKYMSLFATFHDSRDDLFADSAGKSEAQLKVEFMDMRTEIDAFAKNLMKNDPGNPANGVLYAFATPALGYEIWEPKNLELLQGVTNAFEEKWPESPLTSSISMQTFQIDQGYREYAQYSSGNNPAPEISLPDRDGNLVKLSDLRGQYVLIDFWASWCGPCRRENPNVVKLYNKYKDKGFTILSVSLDKNKGKWLEAINKDGLTWPNHVSDLMEWKSPVVGLYGIQGIPHTVLVNKEGNMIGVGLRGETLEQKLNEIFSNE